MALRLLTFNIWFSPFEMHRRMHAIGDILASRQPDLIAFQEMTDEHWRACRSHPAFASYSWSDAARPAARYYTLIGSRLPVISQASRRPFQRSSMGRDLLHLKVGRPSEPPLVFATTHLESLDESQSRREQMEESFAALSSSPDAVICGDTNINEAIDGVVALPRSWTDAWLALRPDDPGYTFDFTHNSMLAQKDSWAARNQARLRYDRFWVKLQSYTIADIELLASPVHGMGKLWPSDHFGLLLTLDRVPKEPSDL
mmetsp:Transcript_100899/g.261134  ORF Transcript_100899/g.261134 Transcript_100899/m.261134 type:complete len:257 (-) Transcript_100899:59-829(-)